MPKSEQNTFKAICHDAAKAFEVLDQLKSLSNQLKEKKNPETDSDTIKICCSQLNDKWNNISEKSNVNIIKKRLNKRKKFKRSSKKSFYQNELSNLFKKMQPLCSNGENLNTKLNPTSEKNGTDHGNSGINEIDKKLSKLKDTIDKLIVYKKLFIVRSQNCKNSSSNNSLVKINALIEQTNHRYIEVDRNKDEIIRNQYKNKAENRLEEFKMIEKNLKYSEHMIKRNLFSSASDHKPVNHYELFQNQSEASIEKLISIRQEWDNFISNSVNSESIPIEWVNNEIVENEQTEWSKYLVLNE